MDERRFYKEKAHHKIWWVKNDGLIGVFEFSFDKKKIYNLFRDYPFKLTKEEKEIFDLENPFWKNYFEERE